MFSIGVFSMTCLIIRRCNLIGNGELARKLLYTIPGTSHGGISRSRRRADSMADSLSSVFEIVRGMVIRHNARSYDLIRCHYFREIVYVYDKPKLKLH